MTRAEFEGRLATRAGAAGLRLDPELTAGLEAYYQLLFTWNQKINLTALNLTELPDEAVDRLFIEPIAAAGRVASGASLLDVGSGGGSPAIPFALASGAAALTMVESRSRKSVFLREAARIVGLPRTEVLTSRFEDIAASPTVKGCFDQVTIRAVKIGVSDWSLLRTPLRPGGLLLFLHQLDLPIPAVEGFAAAETYSLTATAELSRLKRIG